MMLIELCGLYGSGKSTLHRLFLQQHQQESIRGSYQVPRFINARHIASSAARIVPMLWRAGLDRDWKWRLRLLVFLSVLEHDLQRTRTTDQRLLLWDEGPVFMHFVLRNRIRKARNQDILDRELSANLRRMAALLDGVVWLDAPEAILIERVNDRTQPHRFQHMGIDEISALYRRYRQSYEGMFHVCRENGLPVLRVPTDECSPDDAVLLIRDFAVAVAGGTAREQQADGSSPLHQSPEDSATGNP